MPARRPRKVTRAAAGPSLPTPVQSSDTTPLSSAYPSTYPSEAELDQEDDLSEVPIHTLTLSDQTDALGENAVRQEQEARKTFPFLALPSELRIEIYAHHFAECNRVIDLSFDNYKRIHKKLALFRTCRAIYHEAMYFFYSTRTFRIFPTLSGRPSTTKKPLLARLNARQRRLITSLELRLGPHWGKPPRSWVVNKALGLEDCVNVRKLTVFVEVDPSDNIFNGFRQADNFYELFTRNLLDNVLVQMPFLHSVHFDAWSSVKKSGPMMSGLLAVAEARGRRICWGPERGWTDHDDDEAITAARK
ncbi:uncharacterized protein B0T15DRAFT_480 [Chaetomium strumarium]|uniref:DUF7730 domain-containing protein n=1 Tax=Chaetomium strumarium TaxID=1170767 RepID=A0AAJ0H032_9PEZI|nr:hypothetical protein B0T15DRAFT_480 [Chaetomium strumarium]